MKRILTIVSVLSMLALATAASASEYGWTVSASPTDHTMNTSAPGNSILYLHFACSREAAGDLRGMASAEFALEVTGGAVFGASPLNGFLNAGAGLEFLLAVGGCPSGPVAAMQLFVSDPGMEVCFVPSTANGIMGTVDCAPAPEINGMDWIGYNSMGGSPCASLDDLCLPSNAVETESWGSIKGLYR